MQFYSDVFTHPKDEIYVPKFGGSLGFYAVKVFAHVEETGNSGYYKVLVPFDKKVGNNGVLKVRAGLNIGGIEENMYWLQVSTDLITTP